MVTDSRSAAAESLTATKALSESTTCASAREKRAQGRWTLVTLAALAWVDLVQFSGGFARLRRFIKRIRVDVRPKQSPDPLVIERVCSAVDRAALWYVRPALCLPRAAVVTWLLRRHGVPAEMVIGVRKLPFYAHAWVEVGGQVVNDAPTVKERYPELERF